MTGPGVPAGTGPQTTGGRPRRHRWRDKLLTICSLVAVWCLLWGEVTGANVLGGLLVSAVVLVFFPLPPVTFEGRIRPLAVLDLVVRFVGELITASAAVAWVTVRPGYRPRNAIVAVPLRVRTDLNLTLTAEVLSLVPGTLTVEVDRATGTLYVHVLDVRRAADLADSRTRVLALEARLIRAVGSAAEVRLLRTPSTERGELP